MKCHYEVLNVARDANGDEIKKAYKKLAIKWHPDKNLDNTEAATEQFQLIQQAFEVLSDAHERAWYDDHREAILKGKVNGEHDDDSLDVYQYFTTCFKGYGDDEKGFYGVYNEVFNKIAAEDSEYYEDGDSDSEVPKFGRSDSCFDDVKAFYAYWQSYCTKKSYSWLDPYDTRTAENRRTSRLIDKENKKVRDKARKARNEEVRELVNFVRKRDKRVQAHAQYLQELNLEKAKKSEQKRREKIKKRNTELSSQKECEWAKFSNFEDELKNIEASLASEFGESISNENSEDEELIDDQLYCVACNKLFKTPKSFENHESSKKHKDNVEVLKQEMLVGSGTENDLEEESTEETIEDEEDEEDLDGFVSYNGFCNDPFYCNACSKQFKSSKAIEDHRKTEKHLENYKEYQSNMHHLLGDDYDYSPLNNLDPNHKTFIFEPFIRGTKEGNAEFNGEEIAKEICSDVEKIKQGNERIEQDVERICKELEEIIGNSEKSNPSDLESIPSDGLEIDDVKLTKSEIKEYRKNLLKQDSDEDEFFSGMKRKPKKKKNKSKSSNSKEVNDSIISQDTSDSNTNLTKDIEMSNTSQESVGKTQNKKKISKEKTSIKIKPMKNSDSVDTNTCCVVCNTSFPSKNKLFTHLTKTGHSIYLDDKQKLLNKVHDENRQSNKKNKAKQK